VRGLTTAPDRCFRNEQAENVEIKATAVESAAKSNAVTREDAKSAQELLKVRGLYDGEVDGIMGRKLVRHCASIKIGRSGGHWSTRRADSQKIRRDLAGGARPLDSMTTAEFEKEKESLTGQIPEERINPPRRVLSLQLLPFPQKGQAKPAKTGTAAAPRKCRTSGCLTGCG
jgi:hypothetical protein